MTIDQLPEGVAVAGADALQQGALVVPLRVVTKQDQGALAVHN